LNVFVNRPIELSRREVLVGLLALGMPGLALAREPADALRAGGCALLLRHAATNPGIGDPPDFDLAVCSTQRNLSPAGRAGAQRIGGWFKQNGLKPNAVRSSAWCRCQDTARLAFSQFQVWSPLNSVFGDRINLPDQTEMLLTALKAIKPSQFEVWVTHQVNIVSLTQRAPAMGEGFVVDTHGQVLASLYLN
jgi:phosphohistidine phosphatase SixA